MYAQLSFDGVTAIRLPAGDFEFDATHKLPASRLSSAERQVFRVVPFVEVSPPSFDPMTHGVREVEFLVEAEAVTQQFEVFELSDESAKENLRRAVGEKMQNLWQAADLYTSSFISGVAIGLLTMGVLQGKPKALAVQAWSGSVWDEYYRRKADLTAYSVLDTDFSGCGPMPHSVPELRAELGL